jgi:hypothetical protein
MGVAKLFGRGTFTGTGMASLSSKKFVIPITGGSGDFRDVSGRPRDGAGRRFERVEYRLSDTKP